VDRFFSQKTCDRCGGSLENGRTMSMFNEQCICMNCKDKEIKDPDYRKAQDREREEIQKGNFNFKGIRGK
jgi:hypothetical protein